jgi:argininosuccinate lyase
MKLWTKNQDALKEVEEFTIGKDPLFDLQLAPFDVLGSIAHVIMLESVGLITASEKKDLVGELKKIYNLFNDHKDPFQIPDGVEDIHSYIEFLLTERLGEAGKKIHSARSRNDQVLVDLKLFLRNEIRETVSSVTSFFELLQSLSEKYKTALMPGYTHLQLAMPSSFGLWFGAYAESLTDDMILLRAGYDIINKNPLGSAAGYGSSFPINRSMTTDLLGFEELNYNVVYAQMTRGKTERIMAMALANIADSLGRMAMDVCLFMNQNFGFISFPDKLTTGSSIMPHKKNPDVFELVRAHCNRIRALPNEILMITTNLPSGYHRDLQLLKENLFPAFTILRQCMSISALMLSNIIITEHILDDPKYKYLFSVEEVNKLVLEGMTFRDAYKKIGLDIEAGKFNHTPSIHHSHEGSIGNLNNEEIRKRMQRLVDSFGFEKIDRAIEKLISG